MACAPSIGVGVTIALSLVILLRLCSNKFIRFVRSCFDGNHNCRCLSLILSVCCIILSCYTLKYNSDISVTYQVVKRVNNDISSKVDGFNGQLEVPAFILNRLVDQDIPGLYEILGTSSEPRDWVVLMSSVDHLLFSSDHAKKGIEKIENDLHMIESRSVLKDYIISENIRYTTTLLLTYIAIGSYVLYFLGATKFWPSYPMFILLPLLTSFTVLTIHSMGAEYIHYNSQEVFGLTDLKCNRKVIQEWTNLQNSFSKINNFLMDSTVHIERVAKVANRSNEFDNHILTLVNNTKNNLLRAKKDINSAHRSFNGTFESFECTALNLDIKTPWEVPDYYGSIYDIGVFSLICGIFNWILVCFGFGLSKNSECKCVTWIRKLLGFDSWHYLPSMRPLLPESRVGKPPRNNLRGFRYYGSTSTRRTRRNRQVPISEFADQTWVISPKRLRPVPEENGSTEGHTSPGPRPHCSHYDSE